MYICVHQSAHVLRELLKPEQNQDVAKIFFESTFYFSAYGVKLTDNKSKTYDIYKLYLALVDFLESPEPWSKIFHFSVVVERFHTIFYKNQYIF